MDRKRLLLVGVAVLAGLFAAFLAMRPAEQPPTRVAKPVAAPTSTEDVLVAARQLQPGTEVSPSGLKWQPMAADRVPEGAITRRAEPNILTDLQGHLASHAIESGEPVTRAKLQRRSEGGLLASRLTPGMRAISIPIDPKNVRAVGGFVFPNDRVDVVVTLPTKQNESAAHAAMPSRMWLQDIRVLAMGQNLVQTQIMGQKISLSDVATLEVTPEQASRLLAALRESGAEISLVLRPTGDGAQKDPPPGSGQILTIRYGRISAE